MYSKPALSEKDLWKVQLKKARQTKSSLLQKRGLPNYQDQAIQDHITRMVNKLNLKIEDLEDKLDYTDNARTVKKQSPEQVKEKIQTLSRYQRIIECLENEELID